jgi:hypothetical protein
VQRVGDHSLFFFLSDWVSVSHRVNESTVNGTETMNDHHTRLCAAKPGGTFHVDEVVIQHAVKF